ncbi:MAG TPA: methionine aminotransferase [Paenalcaligenes sp.]|nr:methionine aminotransferase [Paenalcaligenes sp.]
MHVTSKLPHLRPNIFSVMSALAAEHQGLNLAQGFPDFPPDPDLAERMLHYISTGYNQYAPGHGVAALREALVEKMHRLQGALYDSETEITITVGASEAIFSTVLALIEQGDEVIILEPAYDIYEPIVTLAGGVIKRVSLQPQDFSVPWDQVRAQVTADTRMIILNTPHNPSGTVLSDDDLQQLNEIVADSQIIVLSDEVYSDLVYAPLEHRSVASVPALQARSVVVGSLGKTYHLTGWKVGFCYAPAALMTEIRKVHSINTFSVHTPSQWALADLLKRDAPAEGVSTPASSSVFLPKLKQFVHELQGTSWQLLEPQGGYFITADYSQVQALADLNAEQCCRYLTTHYGVAAIPYSAFYAQDPHLPLIRFCFAKTQDTLERALSIIKDID